MAGESSINISTKIDNSGITPGLKETSKQIDALTIKFDKQALSIRKQSAAIEGMQKRLESMTDEAQKADLAKGIELAGEKLRITKNEAELTKNKLLELQNIQPIADEQFNKQTVEDINAALDRMIQRENQVKAATDSASSSLNETAANADNVSKSFGAVQYYADEIQAAIDGIAAKSERVPLDFQAIADSVASIVPPISDAMRNMDGMSAKAQSMLATFDRQYLAIQQQTVKLYEMKQAYDEMARTEGIDPQKLEKFGFQINSLTDKINLAAKEANTTRGKFEALISPKVETKTKTLATNMKKVSRDTKSAGTQAHRAANGFEKMANRIGRLIVAAFVFNVIRRGLRELREYLAGLVNTVPAFTQALNEIKVNLATAFQPIAAYIIPAIVKLMQFLSIATAYIATFISALFGKTYEQSKAAAEAINKQAEALKNLKKEAKGVIAPFDKINKLSSETEEDAFSDLFGKVETPEIDMTFIDALKNGLLDVWDVFKNAWDNVGKYVMDGWKYALEQVWGLIKDIAKTFLEVWTDGHGQAFLESLLTLLGTIGYIVGDIAKAFREAWSVYGYDLVVSLFDMLKNVLDLLNSIGVAFREAWNDGLGVSIASNILQIFTNINNVISNLALRLREAWEANGNGVAIWQVILGVVDSVLGAINNITAATAAWASELNLTPLVTGFRNLLEAIKPVVDILLAGLAWAYKNVLLPLGKWLLELVAPVALDILAGMFDVIYEIIKALQPLGLWLWESFLQPIGKWTGDIVVKALKLVADGLKAVADWISKHQKLVEALAIIIGSFVAAWKLVNAAILIWNTIGVIATGVTTAFSAAVAFLTSPIGLVVLAIGALIAIIVLLVKNWDSVKAAGIAAWSGIKSAWNSVATWFDNTVIKPISNFFKKMWDGVISMANTVRDTFKKIFDGLVTIVRAPFNLIIDLLNGMIRGIVSGINAIINAANKVKIPGTSVGVNIPNVNAPQIPRLETGAIVSRATQAIIGENGREAVLPLDRNTEWMDTLADKLASRINATSTPIQSTSNQGAQMQMDGRVFAELIWPYMRQNILDLGISMASGSVF